MDALLTSHTPQGLRAVTDAGVVTHLQNALTLSRAKVVSADDVAEAGATAMELHLQSAVQGTLATINEQAEASVAALVADIASSLARPVLRILPT